MQSPRAGIVGARPVSAASDQWNHGRKSYVARAQGTFGRRSCGLLPLPTARAVRARWNPEGKGLLMKAKVGDWLVMKGTTIDQPGQRGLISEVHSPDGSPPYVVRWLETDHVATVFPGSDALVVTAEEQEAADERAQHRFGAVQSVIRHGKSE